MRRLRRRKRRALFTIGNLPMFIATLLCNPEHPRLDAPLVESLRNAWGGGAARWLNPGIAAEFDLAQTPANLWEVWSQMQALGVDLAVQHAEGRKKAMLLADMDSTMIAQECIDEMADLAGFGAEVAQITARAMNGELDFEPALRARVALFRGIERSIIDRTLAERITYTAGGATLVATMKANGAHCALVSGGFTAFTQAVAAHLGFDENHANILHEEGGKLTGTVAEPILGRAAKVEALERITRHLGLSPAQVIAVGDGANDLGMLGVAGAGVALHAKPSVQAQCSLRINHGDLTALLYLQGYAQSAFVAG